ncbi:uncharacterized protein LOC134456529 [Engraulis encrasicolus]|uniref:uncharacterized protein LOC134456529 n=1 Tax=Engraulis encrasicolus TaxID=184585 RepID=UPI002FD44263
MGATESSESSAGTGHPDTSTSTSVSAEDHSVDRRVFISDHSVHSSVNVNDDHSVRNDFSIRDSDYIGSEGRVEVTTGRGGGNVNISGASGFTGNINIGTHISSARQPRTIRIYYSEKLMERGDFVEGEGGSGGGKFRGTLPFLKVSVPPRKIKYVTVCLESSRGKFDKMIVENYNVSDPENKNVSPAAVPKPADDKEKTERTMVSPE